MSLSELIIASALMVIAVKKLLNSRGLDFAKITAMEIDDLDGIGEVLILTSTDDDGNDVHHTFLRDDVEMALDEAERELLDLAKKCKESMERVDVSEYN